MKKRIIFAAIAALAVVIVVSTHKTEAPVVTELSDIKAREIIEDAMGNQHVLEWTKAEVYYTSEQTSNGDYAEYETRVEYRPEIKGDSVYYSITIREERLLEYCNTKRYPSGPVVVESPKPAALSDIEAEV